MIIIEKLTKKYNETSANPVNALRELSLRLPDFGMVFIVGKSGSGKSTLLNILGGLDFPTSGDISFNNSSLINLKERDLDLYRNECVGFVFQDYNLLNEYNVGTNIGLAFEIKNEPFSKEKIQQILLDLDLTDENGNTLYDRPIKELSGGQKQRVAIARCLVKNPKIVLADEPTGALDAKSSDSLYQILKNISSSRLVVVVSHDLESAKKYGDRIIELSSGSVKTDSCNKSIIEQFEKDSNLVNFKTNKKKIPFKRSLKIAFNGIITKPLKFVISSIISIISCSLFCFSLVAANTDVITANLKTCYAHNVKLAVLSHTDTINSITDHLDGTIVKTVFSSNASFEDKQIEALESNDSITVLKCVSAIQLGDRFGYNNFKREMNESEYFNPYNLCAGVGIERVVEFENVMGELDFIQPDSRLNVQCRMPTSPNEIAITNYWAEMFLRFGYKDTLTGYSENISDINQLLGKTIEGNFKIVGIYKTDEDLDFLKKYDYNSSTDSLDDDYLNLYLRGEHSMNYAFVCKDFIKTELPSGNCVDFLYKLKGNLRDDKKTIESLTYSYEETFKSGVSDQWITKNTHNVSAALTTRFSGFDLDTDTLREPECIKALLIVSVVLAILSSLVLFNYLSNCLDEKKKEFGILRALGSSKFDITRIFGLQCFAISLIDFLGSLFATGIVCLIIDTKFNYWIFNLSVIPIVALIGVCFLIPLLSSIVPLIKLNSKKPIEIIRENSN